MGSRQHPPWSMCGGAHVTQILRHNLGCGLCFSDDSGPYFVMHAIGADGVCRKASYVKQ